MINIGQYDRVISHFDGNNNDPDDIAAIPISAVLTDRAKLSGKSTFFYNNNLGEPNDSSQVQNMRQSAAFAETLGIETYDYQANTQQATQELVEILNSGEKVLSLEGGPMEAIYRGLEQTDPENLDNITLISHSFWNENRDLTTRPGINEARTWDDIKNDFPEVNLIEIQDQNGSADRGFNNPDWQWLDNTDDPVLQEARSLMENAGSKVNDPSDSGMLFYAITGNRAGQPEDAQAFLTANQPEDVPEEKPQPVTNPNQSNQVFLAENGQVVIEAENTQLQGDWEQVTVDGEQSVLWDANGSSYGSVPSGQSLSYVFETDESGQYSIAMHSGRLKQAMSNSDLFRNGNARTDTGNDAYVSIIEEQTGNVIRSPIKLFTGLGSSDGDLRWGNTFDDEGGKFPAQVQLEANTQYRLEVSGRSDGYVLDRITLSNDGFLKNTTKAQSQIDSPSDNQSPTPSQTIRINAGGGDFTDSNGDRWEEDRFYQNGRTYNTGVGIGSTQNDSLFQTERFGKDLSYQIPVTNGRYNVNLGFAEIYWNESQERVFDVEIEDNLVIDDLDIYAEVGSDRALEKSFSVEVEDGMLNLDFGTTADNAKISTIEIEPII